MLRATPSQMVIKMKYDDAWLEGYATCLSDIGDYANEKATDDRLRAFILYIIHEALTYRFITADKEIKKMLAEREGRA